tara:strand:- start:45508 stop:45918 length:411 start_codon:yes stop_codon:yes gene_type:complete
MIEIKKLNPNECWNRVSVMLEKAIELSNGRHTLETTYESICKGIMQLYGIFTHKTLTSVFVTQRMVYPAKQVLCVLFCGGKDFITHIEKIVNFFKNLSIMQGCRGVEIIGRKGWTRVNKEYKLPFKEKGSYYEMDN